MFPSSQSSIRNRYEFVLDRIAESALMAGRKPEEVQLVVVTKGQSVERIREVVDAGAKILGENYVQEALEKQIEFQSNGELEWHMIGHVQSRKAQLVCDHFNFVHSVDRVKLAEKLSHYCTGKPDLYPVLLECNVSGEETKYGWDAYDETRWSELIEPFTDLVLLPHLDIQGLMTMPPYFDNPEKVRPMFKKLRRLQEFLARKVPQRSWHVLSMGMSGDYEVAIQEGATMIRVGTAIMGKRTK